MERLFLCSGKKNHSMVKSKEKRHILKNGNGHYSVIVKWKFIFMGRVQYLWIVSSGEEIFLF